MYLNSSIKTLLMGILFNFYHFVENFLYEEIVFLGV